MSSLGWDLRFAVRALRQHRALSVIVALTLALGLGLNATVLGMADALLLRPFPFRDYDRLVVVFETARGATSREPVAPANFFDWREQATTIRGLVAWEWWNATLTGGQDSESVQGFRVTPGFFELLGITPALGRTFTPDEEEPGNTPRVVLGDGLWRRRFGADPGLVGAQIAIDGESYTVVGIAPSRFAFPVGSELWVPLSRTPGRLVDREGRSFTVAGRLRGGASLATARAEMDVIARRLEREHPDSNRDRGAVVETLSTAFRDDVALPMVALLQAAAALVLLAASANIGGLLLARALERQRELAMRAALGASHLRLVRQLVVETVLLTLFASTLALLFARVGLDVLRSSMPADVARFVEGWDNLRLDHRLVVVTPLLAIAVGVLVGLLPALTAARATLAATLNEGDRFGAGRRRQRTLRALVAAEIALALALLVASGLALDGGARLVSSPGGFDAERLLNVEIPLPDGRYPTPDSRRHFAAALLGRMEALPTTQTVALANILPAAGWSPSTPFEVEGEGPLDPAHRPRAGYRVVSPGFFETMGIPVERGRAFSAVDREDGLPVAIVSASLARRCWPGQDPLGRRVRLEGSEGAWRSVVGVAGDVTMYNWWDGEDFLAVYLPLRQVPPGGMMHAVVRTRAEPGTAAGSVRGAVRSVDPLLPVHRVRAMRQAIADSSVGLTHLASVMGICGGIALALSVLGIWSVMAFAVQQGRREFGVRMAMGATRGAVLRLVMGRAFVLTGVGLLAGFLLALALGRAMSSALLGVVGLDLGTFACAGALLAAVALGAAYLPARRVLRMDPASILRAP